MDTGKIKLLTFVSGNINGVDFTASGTGEADTTTGETKSFLHFSRFPEDFTPRYGKSWKCKHHPRVALEKEGGKNFYSLTKGNYDIVETIRYPGNQVIYSSAQVRQIEPDQQVVFSRFDGICRSRVDVATQLPYDEIITPAGPGRALFHGQRTFVFEDNSEAEIVWDGTIYFVEKEAVLPFEEIVRYEPVAQTRFSRADLRYDKQMMVSVSPRR
ncbi:MAG: hypothetical protein ACYC4A_14760 [Desulfobulbia bacterium]